MIKRDKLKSKRRIYHRGIVRRHPHEPVGLSSSTKNYHPRSALIKHPLAPYMDNNVEDGQSLAARAVHRLEEDVCCPVFRRPDDTFFFFLLFMFFVPHPIYYPRTALARPPSSKSDPGSHSVSSSPLPTTVRAFISYREKNLVFSSLAD